MLTNKYFSKWQPHFTSYFAEYKDQVEEMSVHISETVLWQKYCMCMKKMSLMNFGLV